MFLLRLLSTSVLKFLNEYSIKSPRMWEGTIKLTLIYSVMFAHFKGNIEGTPGQQK